MDFLEGMWAFAVYDSENETLFLSRDRFAEKPLYYYEDESGFYFGSEIKFLKCLSGKSFSVNYRHLMRHLAHGYKALYKSEETYFEDIRELKYAEAFLLHRAEEKPTNDHGHQNPKLMKICLWQMPSKELRRLYLTA